MRSQNVSVFTLCWKLPSEVETVFQCDNRKVIVMAPSGSPVGPIRSTGMKLSSDTTKPNIQAFQYSAMCFPPPYFEKDYCFHHLSLILCWEGDGVKYVWILKSVIIRVEICCRDCEKEVGVCTCVYFHLCVCVCLHVYSCVCVCACRTDAVASLRRVCPVGVLHGYFITSSIAEVSPLRVLRTLCKGPTLTLCCVSLCEHISMRHCAAWWMCRCTGSAHQWSM